MMEAQAMTSAILFLFFSSTQMHPKESCMVVELKVWSVDAKNEDIYYNYTVKDPATCPSSDNIMCGNDKNTIILESCQPQGRHLSLKNVKRNDTISYAGTKGGDCVLLKCGSVVSNNFSLIERRLKQKLDVEFVNNSCMQIKFAKPEYIKSWDVNVLDSDTKEKLYSSTKSTNNILHIRGNFTLDACYDIQFITEDQIPPKSEMIYFIDHNKCYILEGSTPSKNTQRKRVVAIILGVFVNLVVIISLSVLLYRHIRRRGNSTLTPLLFQHKEVLLVHTRESHELTQRVNCLANDILKKTNKKVYDIFDIIPEVLTNPKSWVYQKLHDHKSTAVVLISSSGLVNMLQCINESCSNYEVAVVLGREPHACDTLLTTCLNYLFHTQIIHNPGRVLITRFKDLEKNGDRQEDEPDLLGSSVLYTLPDNQMELLTALNTPLV